MLLEIAVFCYVVIIILPTFGLKRASRALLDAASAGGIASDNSAAVQEQVGQLVPRLKQSENWRGARVLE